MNPALSNFLNLSRWVAALLVVIGHVRHLLLVDYKDVVDKTILIKGFYFITGFGHEAVVMFFIISGYLVGALTFECWKSSGPNMLSFFTARISRIYTVLVPALLIGAALDWIGTNWVNSSELYTDSARYNTSSLSTKIDDALNMSTFFGNLFNLQGILTGPFGSNGPLWSLSYEWWYYCIFALAGAAITGTGTKKIAYAIAALSLTAVLPKEIVLLGSLWILGFFAHAWIKFEKWIPHPLVGMSLFIGALVLSRLSHNVDNLENHESLTASLSRDIFVGVAYLLAVVSASKLSRTPRHVKLHAALADFSYSTYLCHFPMMVFLVALLHQLSGLNFQQQPHLPGLVYFAGLTTTLYLYCYLNYLSFERHTNSIRANLASLFKRDGVAEEPRLEGAAHAHLGKTAANKR